MLVKMRRDATADEVAAVERKLHGLGFKTGKMVGEEITLVGVYGDISLLPVGEIEELAGVEQLIPISRAYKRAAQKGTPERNRCPLVEEDSHRLGAGQASVRLRRACSSTASTCARLTPGNHTRN